MNVFTVIKSDFGQKENMATFDTSEKASAYVSSLEIAQFDRGNLCGISFHIEEALVQ
jgi:hypothetical protein